MTSRIFGRTALLLLKEAAPMHLGLRKILLALSVCSVFATAGPITWNLSGVTFADGGTASGSFVYNADTNAYSSVNITTTLGSLRGGATYQFLGQSPTNKFFFVMTTLGAGDLTGTPTLVLQYSPGLTNAGGTSTIGNVGFESSCIDAVCSISGQPQRSTNAGSVQSVQAGVPEPTSALLVSLGVLVFGAVRARGLRPALNRDRKYLHR